MSVICRLDAKTKLLCVLLFAVLVFIINRFIVILCFLLFLIIICKLAGIPVYGIKIKNLTLLAVFIIFLQTLFGPGEIFILNPVFPDSFPLIGGMGSLKWDGFILGLVIICRFCALIILFSVFSQTTSPYSLALGLNSMGFNYMTAFVITAAFNLIPFFRDEAVNIMDAQKLRGMRSLEKGGGFSRLKAYSGLALPLVLGAMRKAQVSSVIMDSRAFGVYNKRTWMDKPEMKTMDFFFLFVCVVFSAVMLIFNFVLK